MSFIKDKISQKYIKQSFRKANSLFYGEIVGEGKPISGFQNTVNVRIFNGNSILQKGQSGEILQNVPFLSSSSTISVNWKEGDTVVIGYLNSDGNSPYIVSSNFISNVSVNSQGDTLGEGNGAVDIGNGDTLALPDGELVNDNAPETLLKDYDKLMISNRGEAFIKSYEGCRLEVYDAVPGTGDWTIGWGHKTAANTPPITQAEADKLFREDLYKTLQTTFIPLIKNNELVLKQQQFDAMASFTFNYGQNTWASDTRYTTIRNFLLKGDYSESAVKAAYAVYMGSINPPGLIARRNDEIEMFLHGEYTRGNNYTRP